MPDHSDKSAPDVTATGPPDGLGATGGLSASGGNDVASPVPDTIPWARPLSAVGTAATGPCAPRPSGSGADMFLRHVPRSAALVDVLVMAAWTIAAVAVESAAVFFFVVFYEMPLDDPETLKVILLPGLFCRAALLTCGIVVIVRRRRQTWASLGLTARRLGLNLLTGMLTVAVIYGLIWTAMIVILWKLPGLAEEMSRNADNLRALVPKLTPLGFLGLMAMVAWYEEFVFRGFLMTRLRRACGSWAAAVILSTLAFTALHAVDQEWTVLPIIAMLSLVFSLVTIWRRSLVPAITAHLLFDYSQVIGLFYLTP